MPDSYDIPNIKLQKTVNKEVNFNGIGLHSGVMVNMKILPEEPNKGISFIRTDLAGNPAIEACYKNVFDTTLGTSLSNEEGISVKTIEHLMAAFMGLGIDNAKVLISAGEIPIMDGSSENFIKLIERSGIQEQYMSKKVIRVLKNFSIVDGNCSISIEPSKDFIVDYKIDFEDPAIGVQSLKVNLNTDVFKNDISSARTFGLMCEVQAMHKNGLALGGSIENAIVVDNGKILNPEGLRYKDEFVRHKILDFCGDLYLAGKSFQGSVKAVCAGHKLNNRFLLEFFDDSKNYEVIDLVALNTDKEASLAVA